MFYKQVQSLSPGSLLLPNKKRKSVVPVFKEPLVVISFDDAFKTDYTQAYRIMQPLGIKGTSYVNTDYIDRGMSNRLSWENVYEMRANGWDIQCHTHTHARLGDLTEAEIRQEIESVDSSFIAAGLPTPEHHAYPYGSMNALTHSVVGEYRKTLRRTGSTVAQLNNYAKDTFPVFHGIGIDIRSEERLQEIKDIVDIGIGESKVIVLFAHEMVTDTEATAGAYFPYFESLMNYIAAQGVESLTVSELYERLNALE